MYDNIEYLRNFIGKEWIEREIKKIEEKSSLKEVGSRYFNYHPFVQYHYEISYLLRRADALKMESVVLGKTWEKLNRAGYILQLQLEKIVDKLDLRNKLRNSEQFDDVIWELEVGTMLMKNNIKYTFKRPVKGDSNDITCFIDNKPLEIECKNKHIVDDNYRNNNAFLHKLCNKLDEIEILKGKLIEIEFDYGIIEDIKIIVNEIKNNLRDNNSISVLNKYSISFKPEYKKMNATETLNIDKVQNYYLIGKQKKSDLYKREVPIDENTIGIVAKFPNENKNLNNLSLLIKSANKQLPNGGIVFLKVPYDDFENIVKDLEKMLINDFSKVFCIKLISLDSKYIENNGVKISRKEKLILGDLRNCKISKEEFDFLNGNIAFSIYK